MKARNPKGPAGAGLINVRGAGYRTKPERHPARYRSSYPPQSRTPNLGLRVLCGADPLALSSNTTNAKDALYDDYQSPRP